MSEENEARSWALASLLLLLPTVAISCKLALLYFFGVMWTWTELAASSLGPVSLLVFMIVNPAPFTRSAARERRANLKRNWVPWLVVGVFIGVILLIWAAGVVVTLYPRGAA